LISRRGKRKPSYDFQHRNENCDGLKTGAAPTGTITQGSDIWLVESGASKHMTEFRISFTKLTKKSSSFQVELGDHSRNAVNGVGESSYQLDSGNSISIKDVFIVQGLKKNLLSISALED
jgi:hypothetical protein